MSDVTNFIVSDYSGIFEKYPVYNRLLQSLGMFSFEAVDQSRVNFDFLLNNKQNSLESVSRYGSEFKSSSKSKASLHQFEIPHFTMLDSVTPESWQGKRAPGEQRQMRPEDCITDLLVNHFNSFEDTIEQYFADALFRGLNHAPYTQEPVIDLQAEFGLNIQTYPVDLANSSFDINGALDDIQIKIKTALGDQVRDMEKVVAVCSPSYFKMLKAHPLIKEQYSFVAPYDPKNIITNFYEVLPAVQYIEYGGVLFILSTDPLHAITNGDAFYFPKMKKGNKLYKHFGGPASRHSDQAMKGGQRYFQYTLKDPKWANYDVAGEMGIVAVNHLPNCVVKSTNAPTP